MPAAAPPRAPRVFIGEVVLFRELSAHPPLHSRGHPILSTQTQSPSRFARWDEAQVGGSHTVAARFLPQQLHSDATRAPPGDRAGCAKRRVVRISKRGVLSAGWVARVLPPLAQGRHSGDTARQAWSEVQTLNLAPANPGENRK